MHEPNDQGARVALTYDDIAEPYRQAKAIPFQDYVVTDTLFRLIGDAAGRSVLDLGCGEGHNARLVKQAGAALVEGVDVSSEMIRLAENCERAEPLGCIYHVADAADLELDRTYDLVIGAFVLHYAADRQQLLAICRSIARALRPGGRFVGVNTNMALDLTQYGKFKEYGRWLSTTAERCEGDPITVHLIAPDGTEVRFDNYYLSPATYEAVFAEAGLREFRWERPSVSKAGLNAFPAGYWDRFLDQPQIIGICAGK